MEGFHKVMKSLFLFSKRKERLTIKSQQENEDFLNKTSLGVLDSPEAGLSLNQYLENRMMNRASEQVLTEEDMKFKNYLRKASPVLLRR